MQRRGLVPYIGFMVAVTLTASAGMGRGAETPNVIQDALINGLRWYFHWQKPLRQASSLSCHGQAFEENYFVYCSPVPDTVNIKAKKAEPVTVDMTARSREGVRINVISSTDDDSPTSFRLFGAHQPVPTTSGFLLLLGVGRIARYETDSELSRERMNATVSYMRNAIRVYEQRGLHVRCLFPLVAKGDPFYEVYLVEGDRLDSVWLFPVAGDALQDYPSWVYDRPHRNIPETAESHLADASRWYAALPGGGAK
jgi:hypothetical protein